MGIKFLNTFLNTYPVPLLEDTTVYDTPLVIDGSELVYHLMFEKGQTLDVRCGGEYTSLREVTVEFFEALKKCNIKAYVIFDDFKSESNLVHYLKKKTQRLAAIREIVDGRGEGQHEMPRFGKYSLKQTLIELEIPFVVVPGDGDPELAAIANKLGAPVLASDTDFCVFNLEKGFLLFRHFEWKDLRNRGKRAMCPGKIFRRNILTTVFKTPGNAIAFLEPLMSAQDGLQGVNFDDFLKRLSRDVRIPYELHKKAFRRPNSIETLLIWLGTSYTDDDSTIGVIQRSVDVSGDDFTASLNTYRVLPNVTKYVDSLKNESSSADKLHSWCTYMDGNETQPMCFLPLLMDDYSQNSSHEISLPIRKALYEVAFFQKAKQFGKKCVPRVMEIDRSGSQYNANVVPVTVDEEKLQPLGLDLDHSQTTTDHEDIISARKQYVFNILHGAAERDFIEFKAFGTGIDMLAATVKYWHSRQREKPPLEVCRALAFTFAACNDGISEDGVSGDFPVATSFDVEALHYSSQWQCCMCETVRLNQYLGCPTSNPVIGKLFSGKLFQKAFSYFQEELGVTDMDIASKFFQEGEDAHRLFMSLMNLMGE